MAQSINFLIIDHELKQMGLGLSAAETHGMMCGIICVDQQASSSKRWQQLIFADKPATETLMALFKQSYEQLIADEFEFDLLLPAESESIARRTQALADWSQGFLSGLGVAGLKKTIDGEIKSTLNDLIEICKAYCQEEINEENDEISYVELVEYVRMAVIFIFTELHLSGKVPSDKNNK